MNISCDLCLHLTLSSVQKIHNNLTGGAEKLRLKTCPYSSMCKRNYYAKSCNSFRSYLHLWFVTLYTDAIRSEIFA